MKDSSDFEINDGKRYYLATKENSASGERWIICVPPEKLDGDYEDVTSAKSSDLAVWLFAYLVIDGAQVLFNKRDIRAAVYDNDYHKSAPDGKPYNVLVEMPATKKISTFYFGYDSIEASVSFKRSKIDGEARCDYIKINCLIEKMKKKPAGCYRLLYIGDMSEQKLLQI